MMNITIQTRRGTLTVKSNYELCRIWINRIGNFKRFANPDDLWGQIGMRGAKLWVRHNTNLGRVPLAHNISHTKSGEPYHDLCDFCGEPFTVAHVC